MCCRAILVPKHQPPRSPHFQRYSSHVQSPDSTRSAGSQTVAINWPVLLSSDFDAGAETSVCRAVTVSVDVRIDVVQHRAVGSALMNSIATDSVARAAVAVNRRRKASAVT